MKRHPKRFIFLMIFVLMFFAGCKASGTAPAGKAPEQVTKEPAQATKNMPTQEIKETPTEAIKTPTDTGKAERTKDIVILYTGDVHCAVDKNIGYAGLSAYKKSLEEEGKEVLLVDTGDATQGAAIGSFSNGEDIIRLMNEVGYDAMTLGNHEFDYGGIEVVKKMEETAEFPLLCLNLHNIKTGEYPFLPHTILERDGIRIAFVGVTSPETLYDVSPAYFTGEDGEYCYSFFGGKNSDAFYTAVQNAVDGARKEGADYVIAMTHMGILEASEPYTSNTLIASTTGIDAVLDGHSHSVIECERVKNKNGEVVLLSSTGTKLANIGELSLKKDGTMTTGLVHEVGDKDEAVTASVQRLFDKYEERLGIVIGTLENDLIDCDPQTGERVIRNAETNLGDFCADAYRVAGDSDIAFINGGGIRAALGKGEVTYRDMLSVHPFGNFLCKARVKGQVILDALELSVSALPEESGGFLQVSGLTFEIDMDVASSVVTDEDSRFLAVEGERRVKNVFVGGRELDAAADYTVVSIGYILKDFGNGYSMFKDAELLMDEFILDVDAISNYMNGSYQSGEAAYEEPYGTGRIVLAE